MQAIIFIDARPRVLSGIMGRRHDAV